MKKQIIHFTFLAIFALWLGACGNDAPTSNTTPDVPTTEQKIGATGIPAIDNLTEQIAQNPNNAALHFARANEFYKNEGYDGAIADMAAAMKIDSVNADYHHFLTDVYLDYYKSRLALQTMKRCVGLYPKRIPSLLKLAEVQQILKQYDASMRTIAQIMAIEPNNPEGFFMIGVNHTLLGNKPMAIKNLQRCVSLDPDHTDGFILLGKIFDEDDKPLAAQYFENAVQTAPNNPDVLYNQASYLHNHDQLDKSMTVLKKIISIDKNYADAFHRMGVIYIEKDSLTKANENFNIAVSVDPQYGLAYYYRGYTSELLGNLQAAKTDYQNILNFEPDYQKAKEGIARVTKALEKGQ